MVKAWNTLYSETIRRSPRFDGARPTVFVAGNDPAAREDVAGLVQDLGYEAADAGLALRRPLSRAACGADDLARPGLGRPARACAQAARADRSSPPAPGCERDQLEALGAGQAAVRDLQSRNHGESEEGQGLSRLGLSDDAHTHRAAQAVDEDGGDRGRDARDDKALPRRARQRPRRLLGRARRSPRYSRRERRRQDNVLPHRHRSLPGRRGEISCTGNPCTSRRRATRSAGVCIVHQHFRLVDRFTVAENIVLGDHRGEGRKFLDRPTARRGAGRRARRTVPARRSIRAPRLAALGRRATAGRDPQGALPGGADPDPRRADVGAHPPGGGTLFVTLRQMASEGRTVIFISHKLHEVKAVSDRVTVMRAGRRSRPCTLQT